MEIFHNIYNHKNTYLSMVDEEEDKKDTLRVNNSRKLYIPIYIMILILVLVLSFANYSGKEIDDLAFKTVIVFSIVALISTEINRHMNSYEINSQSLIHRKGIITQITKRVDLTAISDADSNQHLMQRILNYGNVSVHLFSRDGAIPVHHINNPKKFVDFLEEKMNEKRLKSEGGLNK